MPNRLPTTLYSAAVDSLYRATPTRFSIGSDKVSSEENMDFRLASSIQLIFLQKVRFSHSEAVNPVTVVKIHNDGVPPIAGSVCRLCMNEYTGLITQ